MTRAIFGHCAARKTPRRNLSFPSRRRLNVHYYYYRTAKKRLLIRRQRVCENYAVRAVYVRHITRIRYYIIIYDFDGFRVNHNGAELSHYSFVKLYFMMFIINWMHSRLQRRNALNDGRRDTLDRYGSDRKPFFFLSIAFSLDCPEIKRHTNRVHVTCVTWVCTMRVYVCVCICVCVCVCDYYYYYHIRQWISNVFCTLFARLVRTRSSKKIRKFEITSIAVKKCSSTILVLTIKPTLNGIPSPKCEG